MLKFALPWACLAILFLAFGSEANNHEYSNQFAVHVPEGADEAKRVASRHGFAFHGQVSLS